MAQTDDAHGARGTDWAESDLHLAFAASVRLRRADSHVTQEGLGLATGLHRNYVGAIERAEVNPTLHTIARISAGLGTSIAALMELAETIADDPATVASLRARQTNRGRPGEATARHG